MRPQRPSGPMLVEDGASGNVETSFWPIGRGFAIRTATDGRIGSDFSLSGHTSPFVIPAAPPSSGCCRGRPTQSIDPPQDFPDEPNPFAVSSLDGIAFRSSNHVGIEKKNGYQTYGQAHLFIDPSQYRAASTIKRDSGQREVPSAFIRSLVPGDGHPLTRRVDRP